MNSGSPSENQTGTGLASFSIRYPVTICMIFVSIVTLGLISTSKIPLVLFPDVEQPSLFIYVPYRNATPLQIQQSITRPLEEALSTVPGVKRMRSSSGSDYAWISLFFDWGEDIDMLRVDVREKIDRIRNELPDDLEHVWIRNWETGDIPILEGRIASGKDLRTAADFLELKIKRPLEAIPGVAEVEIWGAQRQEVDVYLRLDDLKRHRVNVAELFRRLQNSTSNRSLGRAVDGGTRYNAVARGSIKSLDEIREFPVSEQGLVLGDVADVIYDDPLITSGWRLNGEYSVGFAVRKTSEANTVETVRRVLDEVEVIKQDPSLEGIELLVWHDAGEEITKSLRGLLGAGVIGAVLASAVLFLFLRKFKATLVVSLAIPFSIVAAIGFLYMSGNTLNVLSMLGLMLATGMLVDNAVVVLESIYQKLEKGMDPLRAARVGTGEVYMAVICATLTSVIIFVPLIFGKQTDFSVFLGHAGIAIMFALGASLFISLTLIPLAMGRALRVEAQSAGRASSWTERLTKAYVRTVTWNLDHRWLSGFVIVPLILVGSGWLLFNKIPDNSPESRELGSLQIDYEFSENFHYVKIEQDYVVPVEQYLFANRERFKIKDVFSNFGNDNARTRVYFDKDRVRASDMEEIRKQIGEGLPVVPGAEIRLGGQSGAQSRNFINTSFYGDDPMILQELSNEAKRRLLARPDFSEVYTALDRAQEEVQIRLQPELARKYDISSETAANVLGIVLRGSEIHGFRTEAGEVEVFVRLAPEDRSGLKDLESIVVGAGPSGEPILISQVADFTIEKIPGELVREDRRTFTEMFSIYTGEKRDEGMKQIKEVLDGLDYAEGYGWSYGFWTMRQQDEDRDFLFNILLALFMVYFVMASLFESLAHPFAIMLSLPFALVGIAIFLFVTGTPFNLMAKIGLLVLIGIVVNNGIVLVDHINNFRRGGLARRDAVLTGCRERMRPILMTASTTIVGLAPLAFSQSSMFDMRYFPMARTVMGGLMASTILTLIVLPTYYTLFDDLSRRFKEVWLRSSAALTGLGRDQFGDSGLEDPREEPRQDHLGDVGPVGLG